MATCQAKTCKNNYRKNILGDPIHFFRFPKNEVLREKWKKALGLEKMDVKDPRICSIHFNESCYQEETWIEKRYNLRSHKKRTLKVDAVPTVHLTADAKEKSSTFVQEIGQNEEADDLQREPLTETPAAGNSSTFVQEMDQNEEANDLRRRSETQTATDEQMKLKHPKSIRKSTYHNTMKKMIKKRKNNNMQM